MKPRKDVSVVGRLNGQTSQARRANYGVDRLGISGTDDGGGGAGGGAGVSPAEAAGNDRIAGKMPTPPVTPSAPAAAPSVEVRPAEPAERLHSEHPSYRRWARLGIVAVVVGGLLATYAVYRNRNASDVPAPAVANGTGLVPARPTAVLPTAVPTAPPVSVVPRQDWLHPTLRGYFANGAVAFYTFREQVRQTVASWDRPHQTPPRPTPAPIEIVTLPAASQPTSQPATAPAIRYRECPSGLSLSGVIHTPDGAFASINGKMVKVGGVANGATLTAIRDFSVEMEIAGERFILGIGESSPAAGPSDEGPSDEPATKPAKKIKSKAKVKAKRPHTQPAEEEDEPAPEE